MQIVSVDQAIVKDHPIWKRWCDFGHNGKMAIVDRQDLSSPQMDNLKLTRYTWTQVLALYCTGLLPF